MDSAGWAVCGLIALTMLLIWGAYHKGCSDTWRAADEIAQIEPLVPPITEPRPIVLPGNNPLTWNKLVSNCPECPPGYLDESEQEQTL